MGKDEKDGVLWLIAVIPRALRHSRGRGNPGVLN